MAKAKLIRGFIHTASPGSHLLRHKRCWAACIVRSQWRWIWVADDDVGFQPGNTNMFQSWFGKAVDREDLTRHDKWLCMMMLRLKLLKELMRNDGAIFISIDDNEMHRLRSIMDEVFGEENFVSSIAIRANPRGRQSDEFVATLH